MLVDSQQQFCDEAVKAAKALKKEKKAAEAAGRVFIPRESPE